IGLKMIQPNITILQVPYRSLQIFRRAVSVSDNYSCLIRLLGINGKIGSKICKEVIVDKVEFMITDIIQYSLLIVLNIKFQVQKIEYGFIAKQFGIFMMAGDETFKLLHS